MEFIFKVFQVVKAPDNMFLTEPGLQGSCHRWGEKTVDKNSLSQASMEVVVKKSQNYHGWEEEGRDRQDNCKWVLLISKQMMSQFCFLSG